MAVHERYRSTRLARRRRPRRRVDDPRARRVLELGRDAGHPAGRARHARDDARPPYDDGETQIYETYLPVPLPLRKPSRRRGPERSGRAVSASAVRPRERHAHHGALHALEPRGQAAHGRAAHRSVERVRPLLRPASWSATETTTPNFSGIDRFFVIPPKGRIEGILTPDDIVEIAVDLGTAMELKKWPPAADGSFAGPALYNRAFNMQNRSSQPDPLLVAVHPERAWRASSASTSACARTSRRRSRSRSSSTSRTQRRSRDSRRATTRAAWAAPAPC